MIIKFSVQNFGSIKDKQTLSFEADKSTHLEDFYVIEAGGMRLLKMALIYGANASGKTTILNALNFLRDIVTEPKDKKTDTFDFNPFLFDTETPHQNTILAIEFLSNSVRYQYEVELNKKAIVREQLDFFNPNKANVYKRTTNLESQFTEIAFGSKIKVDKIAEKTLEANTLWNNTVLGGYLKTNIELEELENAKAWFDKRLFPTFAPNFKLDDTASFLMKDFPNPLLSEKIIQILQKADFNISDIIIERKEGSNYDIKIEHTLEGKSYQLPFELESLGTQRYYGFASYLSLAIKYPVIYPIDELESSLHPDLYTHFLLSFLANTKKSQLIATTHNREILNNKDIFRNDAIWITDKSENCATELYSLADFDTSVIRDTSNVYNAYKIGKLGGVPNLGDYYIDVEE